MGSYSQNKGIISEGKRLVNLRSESNPLKTKLMKGSPHKGAKTGAVLQGLAMSVDLRKKAKKGIESMGIDKIGLSTGDI